MSNAPTPGPYGYPAAPPTVPMQQPPVYDGPVPFPPAAPPAPPAWRPPTQPGPAPRDPSGPSGRRRGRGGVAVLLALLFVLSLLAGGLVGGTLVRTLDGADATAAGPSADPTTAPPSLPARPRDEPTPPTSLPDDPTGEPSTGPADVSGVADEVIEGAVDISTQTAMGQGAGTGMVLSEDGIVLTNHHVVEGAYQIRVTDLDTGEDYDAEVLGTAPSSDVAVLQLVDAADLTTVSVGNSDSVGRGDTVVAIGNSDGQPGNPQVIPGQVVGSDRSIVARDAAGGGAQRLTGLIEIRADIGPGDSGGPVADVDGDVIGLTTAASFDQRSGSTTGEGYVVPINGALELVDKIVSGQDDPAIERGKAGVLGVQVSSTNGVDGAAVLGVADGSGAQDAGVSAGSVITAVDGRPVASAESLTEALDGRSPGDDVTLTWTDPDGQSREETVTLGEGPVR